jgi:DNA repair protein RecO (recombination protein O)
MPLVSDRCICLRKVEYSESSQILTLLSRDHGLVRVIAKGAHRRTKQGASKFDGGADLLDRGDAVFTHDPNHDLETLTEWGLREGHLGLRKTLRGMYLALYAGELCSLLIEEHDPHPTLFDLLEQTLLDLETDRREEAFLTFQLDLLRESGYLPELAACVSCGLETSSFVIGPNSLVYFSPSRGGLICRACESSIHDRLSLDPRLVRLLQVILRHPNTETLRQRLNRLTRQHTDPLNRILSLHVQHMLGRRLRLTPYILAEEAPVPVPAMVP